MALQMKKLKNRFLRAAQTEDLDLRIKRLNNTYKLILEKGRECQHPKYSSCRESVLSDLSEMKDIIENYLNL